MVVFISNCHKLIVAIFSKEHHWTKLFLNSITLHQITMRQWQLYRTVPSADRMHERTSVIQLVNGCMAKCVSRFHSYIFWRKKNTHTQIVWHFFIPGIILEYWYIVTSFGYHHQVQSKFSLRCLHDVKDRGACVKRPHDCRAGTSLRVHSWSDPYDLV